MDDPELETVYKEHREYPSGTSDDILDTLADAIEILNPPGVHKKATVDYSLPTIRLNSRNRFQTGYNYYA